MFFLFSHFVALTLNTIDFVYYESFEKQPDMLGVWKI